MSHHLGIVFVNGAGASLGSASRGLMVATHEFDAAIPDLDWAHDDVAPAFTLNLAAFAGRAAAESLSRRVKSLACTAPLHALKTNKVRVAEGRRSRLNCWELAFVAIDAVAVAMDFDTGASYDQTIALLARQATRQDPTLTALEAADAAQWVVEGLISGRGGDEPFQAAYGRWEDGGDYEARGFHVDS